MPTITQGDLSRLLPMQTWASEAYELWEGSCKQVVEQLISNKDIEPDTHHLFYVLSAKLLAAESARSKYFKQLENAFRSGATVEEGPYRTSFISMACGMCPPGIIIINDDAPNPTPPTLARISPDTHLLIKDTIGRVQWGNHHFAHHVNRSLTVLKGKRSDEIFNDKYGTTILDHDLSVVSNGSPIVCIETVRIGGTHRRRVAIRLPLRWIDETIIGIGVIGFNPAIGAAEQLITKAAG